MKEINSEEVISIMKAFLGEQNVYIPGADEGGEDADMVVWKAGNKKDTTMRYREIQSIDKYSTREYLFFEIGQWLIYVGNELKKLVLKEGVTKEDFEKISKELRYQIEVNHINTKERESIISALFKELPF